MTQVGQRLIQKVWKWAKPSEVGARVWKIVESWGMNHDRYIVTDTVGTQLDL